MFTTFFAAISLVSAQAPDRYQKVGNDIGEVFNSIGAVLKSGDADAKYLSDAANSADVAVASLRSEFNDMDWSFLGPQAAVQHTNNMHQYLNNLEAEKARLHVMATQAAVVEQVPLAQAHGQNKAMAPMATSMPRIQNKAVVREESKSSITESASHATATDAAESEAKESKSESKMSKEASKSDSQESKSSSKSAAKSSTGSARNATSSSSSSSPSTEAPSAKNAAAATGVSGGALALAVIALI